VIVTCEITPESDAAIGAHGRAAAGAHAAMADGLETAVVVGAESVTEQLVMGQLGLTMQNQASGLAASMAGWMIDRRGLVAALGIPPDSPAAHYARMLNDGGVILPRRAKALAIPVSQEAKRHESPRDMDGLEMIPRKDKPPLLVRKLTKRGDFTGMQVHWILVASVTIPAFHWLDNGAENAVGDMVDAFVDVLEEWMGKWD